MGKRTTEWGVVMFPECPYCNSQDMVEVEDGAYVCQECLEHVPAEDIVWVGEEADAQE